MSWGGAGTSWGGTKSEPSVGEQTLAVAIREAMEPIVPLEDTWTLDEMCSKVSKYLSKATNKFWKDERLSHRGHPAHAQAVVADFVDCVMGAMSNALWEKAWFIEVNLSVPIFEALMSICKNTKCFCRVLLPCVLQYVEEGIVRFREEDRVGGVFTAVVAGSGLDLVHQKKCAGFLSASYDEAFTTAPFGSFPTEDPSTQLLKDFVLGWVRAFVGRGYHLLENVVSPEKDQQMLFVTALFQQVVGPELRCLPIEIVQEFGKPDSIGILPDASWPFVAEAVEAVFAEIDEQVAAAAVRPPKPAKIARIEGADSVGANFFTGPPKLQWLTQQS